MELYSSTRVLNAIIFTRCIALSAERQPTFARGVASVLSLNLTMRWRRLHAPTTLKVRRLTMEARVHIHLSVLDLTHSRIFYEKFFGVAPTKDKGDHLKFEPPFAPINLAI